MRKIISICVLTIMSQFSQAQIYGPYVGASAYGYKSNLFNSDDLRVDSFQKYKITPGFSGSFDFGYLYENGVSINTGIQIGNSNQKYQGGDTTYPYQFDAMTKLTSIKIPLTFGKQRMDGEKKTVLIYSAGFYYTYNASYKDRYTVDFTNKNTLDYEVVTEKKTQTSTFTANDSVFSTLLLDRRPYTRHGFGAVANLGVAIRLKEKLDLTILAKSEFQINNAEITEKITYRDTKSSASNPILPYTDYAFGNYSKYLDKLNQNHNRAGTHPFNIGISVGLRYYIFEF